MFGDKSPPVPVGRGTAVLFPAPHWKWRVLELWLILSLYQLLNFFEPEEKVPARVSSWARPMEEDRIVKRASAGLKISCSCHRTFHIPPLEKISSLVPWCKFKTWKFHVAVPNLAQALLGLLCHAVNNQTQAFCMCGTGHPFYIYLVPEAFCTSRTKTALLIPLQI